MKCPHCQSAHTQERPERTELGYHRFRCRACGREFNERTGTLFNRLQYPSDVVCLVVLWRLRYKLSLRDLAEMFLKRGFVFTHETVRIWEATFAPLLTDRLRKHRYGQGSRRWHVDETLIKVNGKWVYLYRALDHEGNLLDVRLSETCDLPAARAFFRVVAPSAVAIATGNPIGLIVVGGLKLAGEASGRSTLEGRAKATADAIAEQLKIRFRDRGWITG
jgi:hypothetical protein